MIENKFKLLLFTTNDLVLGRLGLGSLGPGRLGPADVWAQETFGPRGRLVPTICLSLVVVPDGCDGYACFIYRNNNERVSFKLVLS